MMDYKSANKMSNNKDLIEREAVLDYIKNKNMKIYIVEASSGSYDSYHTWIHSVHLKPQPAEESMNKINGEWEAKKNTLPPFPVDEFGDLIEEGLSEDEKKKYYQWWHKDYQASEWGGAKTKEYETETIYAGCCWLLCQKT